MEQIIFAIPVRNSIELLQCFYFFFVFAIWFACNFQKTCQTLAFVWFLVRFFVCILDTVVGKLGCIPFFCHSLLDLPKNAEGTRSFALRLFYFLDRCDFWLKHYI